MEWIGVPFHHQARIKDGCDCIGLVIGVARIFGYDKKVGFTDYNKYERMPDTDLMTELLDRYLDRIPLKKAEPADILHLYFIQRPQHVGFLMPDNTIVHASWEQKRVIHHRIDPWWKTRIVNAYRFRGIK